MKPLNLETKPFLALIALGLCVATFCLARVPDEKEAAAGKVRENAAEIEELSFENLSKMGISELVQQLENENFKIRDKATKLLWKRGKSALNELKLAAQSKHPEVVSRASYLIRMINIGILPDTPPHLAELVEKFPDAKFNEKGIILKKLHAEKAYSEMLLMLSEMENRDLARQLYNDFSALGHQAARHSLSKGDLAAAIEQLKISPRSESTLRSLAYIYKINGELEAEIQRVKNLPEKLRDSVYLRYLILGLEDRDRIREYAKDNAFFNVTATLDLLQGNTEKVYQRIRKNANLETESAMAILLNSYTGKNDALIKTSHEAQIKKLSTYDQSYNSNEMQRIFSQLILTGGIKMAKPHLAKFSKFKAFYFFDEREKPSEALAALGITDQASLDKFILVNTNLALEEIEKDRNDLSKFRGAEALPFSQRLMIVANFYYRRGEYKTARSVLALLLRAFEKQKNKAWYELIGDIGGMRMYDMAVDFTLERGDGDDTYKQVVNRLYGDSSEVDMIWRELRNREGLTAEESFRDLAILMGVDQTEIQRCEEIQQQMIKLATRRGVANLKIMEETLLFIANYRQDSINAKRFTKKLLDKEKEESVLIARKIAYYNELSNDLDWKGLVDFLHANPSVLEAHPKAFTFYSIANRKLGNVELADELLKQAKLMSLGMVDHLFTVAREHAFAGYHETAIEILEDMLISWSVNGESRVYINLLNYLSNSNSSYIYLSQWSKAAAFSLANSARELVFIQNKTSRFDFNEFNNMFYQLKFARGMELYLAGDQKRGIKMLEAAHRVAVGSGVLADYFYPAMKSLDIKEYYDAWVEDSYRYLKNSIIEFPRSANTHNTLAWVLAKSVRKLDEGIELSKESLKLRPEEPPYLDTMAELYHAKGDRRKAIQWGEKAVLKSRYGTLDSLGRGASARARTYSLSGQLERFRHEPHPQP